MRWVKLSILSLDEMPELKQGFKRQDFLKNKDNRYSVQKNQEIDYFINEAERFMSDSHYHGAKKIVDDTLFKFSEYIHNNQDKKDIKFRNAYLTLISGEAIFHSIMEQYETDVKFPVEDIEKINDCYRTALNCLKNLKNLGPYKEETQKKEVAELLQRAKKLEKLSQINIGLIPFFIDYVNNTTH
jgi:hypothetical protein